MTYSSTDMQLPQPMLNEARRAALLGTRQLIADEQFSALVALLVAAEVIPAEKAQRCLIDLSSTLKGHAQDGHPAWQVEPAELRIHAERLAVKAAQIGGAS